MAVIHQIAAQQGIGSSGIGSTLLDAITKGLWEWVKANPDVKVFTVHIWIIQKTFYVRDLEAFVELLLGPNPA